jgi:hypothetical protein
MTLYFQKAPKIEVRIMPTESSPCRAHQVQSSPTNLSVVSIILSRVALSLSPTFTILLPTAPTRKM